LANKAITWATRTIANIGVEAEAWDGLLGFTFDVFQRKSEGMMANRAGSLPGIVGASLPQENLNSGVNRGFDVELSHRNKIGDLRYWVRGNIAYTMYRNLHVEGARYGNSYINWRTNTNNRNNGIWWGYGDNGRITSWDEIYHNPIYIARNTIMGDYEYEDWNGDGMINELDLHPIANNSTVPLLNYGLNIAAEWRGIDLSIVLQGGAGRKTSYVELLYEPLWSNTNAMSYFLDRWHPVDPDAYPYDPATQWVSGQYGYTGSLPNQNSPFNMQNASYLRLKSLEIGYSLPEKWLNTAKIRDIRVYFSSYNTLTFTKMKYADPEFPSSSYGYNYPLNKTFTLGVNVKF
jgi:hypothetical protein